MARNGLQNWGRIGVVGTALGLGGYGLLPSPARPAAPPPRGALTEHVVVISVDGLRPDAILKFGTRTLPRLMREGSYTLSAQTVRPSRTLPSHTSMLTGEEPDEHGVTWNPDRADPGRAVQVPTIFAGVRGRGLRTAAFFSKSKFHHLQVPNTLDHSEVPDRGDGWSAAETTGRVERHLARERPNLLFMHLSEPDSAGHRHGWMSEPYGEAVRTTDRAVARILRAADRSFGEGRYTVILTADHGGHGRDHGSGDPRDTTIPRIAWGQGVRAGTALPDGIRTLDTAATTLWLLGITEPTSGEPIRIAFEPPAPMPLALDGDRGAMAPVDP